MHHGSKIDPPSVASARTHSKARSPTHPMYPTSSRRDWPIAKSPSYRIPLYARTRGSVVGRMTELAARTHLLWDPDKMARRCRARRVRNAFHRARQRSRCPPAPPPPATDARYTCRALLALGISPFGLPSARRPSHLCFFLNLFNKRTRKPANPRALSRVMKMIKISSA